MLSVHLNLIVIILILLFIVAICNNPDDLKWQFGSKKYKLFSYYPWFQDETPEVLELKKNDEAERLRKIIKDLEKQLKQVLFTFLQ